MSMASRFVDFVQTQHESLAQNLGLYSEDMFAVVYTITTLLIFLSFVFCSMDVGFKQQLMT